MLSRGAEAGISAARHRATPDPAPILGLPERIARLPDAARTRAERIFEVDPVAPVTDPPPSMEQWITAHFGSVSAVRDQQVLRVANRISLASAVFAPLRAQRPIDGMQSTGPSLDDERTTPDDDPFCRPLEGTPANAFGRIRGRHTVTGANAAAGAAHHGVIVFDRHDPLAFDDELVADVLRVGRDWADAARGTDPTAASYLLLWNCLWRAGGSIVHGHAQVMLDRGRHHGELERLRRDAAAYRAVHDASYLDDLVAVHRDLGLALGFGGVDVLASLTPAKEREVMLVGRNGEDERSPAFSAAVARALCAYRDALGVRAFNLVLLRPPLGADGDGEWRDLRPVVRLVDRGDPASRTSDVGATELLAGTVLLGGDPYETIAALREPPRS